MRDHGGNLQAAIAAFGGTAADWIDLSTGINARPYPVGPIPPEAWNRLPERSDLAALEQAAQSRYLTSLDVVAVAGAQAAIQLMPLLRPTGRASVLTPTYNEHAAALRAQGWQVTEAATLAALSGSDVAVVVNPNNPDGQRHAPDTLAKLAANVGLLIVDESFVDPEPELSVARKTALPENLIILRSFGKFYGLAGLRLGFALCHPALSAQLRTLIGPWPVSGMAIAVAHRALHDSDWTDETTARLTLDANRLDALAQDAGWTCVGGTPLFRTYHTANAAQAQTTLARHHIWTRIFPYSNHWIRLGLPGHDTDWTRLGTALHAARTGT
ncbi:threonine-phosphate decarboxylase CobD [Puniceibacterium sediminis]|uniref:threonine-phosphate decarboxylase n=1 Tax=Puniceibacterium sediminis TaxID=1608407 RepID=A0A238WBR3_9RHOB|nr:threonine-phosphate decarboxylase CobD [Puniceibacterium sediminis]SNR43724.1 L-threonine O-3-phosphate decarboxylase [Puniceibacterium sediminis]